MFQPDVRRMRLTQSLDEGSRALGLIYNAQQMDIEKFWLGDSQKHESSLKLLPF